MNDYLNAQRNLFLCVYFLIPALLCHSVMSVSFKETYQLIREGECVELILVKTDGGVGPVTVSIFTISDSAESKSLYAWSLL